MTSQNNSPDSARKISVLYIDDDQSNRQLVQFILDRREDLLLIEADTGTTGLQIAVEQRPDIILLDLGLPDMHGFKVLEQLQRDNSTTHVPVIAVSGDSLPEDIEKGMNAGFQGYLTKPIQINKLYDIIDRTIKTL